MHLSYAKAFAAAGDVDNTLNQLEYFTNVASNPTNYPVTFKSSAMFDCMDDFYKKLDLGNGSYRSDETITKKDSPKTAFLTWWKKW